jgi:vitamin B12 transporter
MVSIFLAASVFGQSEGETDALSMIYKDQDLVTPTRSPKPISQVGENVTVIDAEEIEAINAHTLADVLYHVTGVQVDVRGGPGSSTNVLIQGSDPRHVRVMVDGVTINNLTDNFPDIGAFPIQQIERIEIIKGPASSTWGSSLGGIINIITKSPDPEHKIGGSVSAAIGERTTGDYRADMYGTAGSFAYYIFGGGITSDGLTANTGTGKGDFYTKLQWQPARQTHLQLTVGYDKGSRGDGQAPLQNLSLRDSFEYFFASPSFTYDITDSLNIEVAARVSTKRNRQYVSALDSGAELQSLISNELSAGGSAKLNWRTGMNNILVGADYDNGAVDSAGILDGRQSQVRWAIFSNDTLALGDLSVTPGIRYDHTSTNGDFVSPSIGLTYTLFGKTIFRGAFSRGFNTPPIGDTYGNGISSNPNPNLKVEEVRSYSLGVETAVLKDLWLKVTGFLHDIRDVITPEVLSPATFTYVNGGKQRRQGVEAELRTAPLFHTSLLAGYTFIDATDRVTGQEIAGIPRYSVDLGIDYNDNDSLRGALRGHYIWWNGDPDPTVTGKYTAMIWDMNLAKKFFDNEHLALEAFFTAHNIFNGAQYTDNRFPNPQRWFEGGLKCRF